MSPLPLGNVFLSCLEMQAHTEPRQPPMGIQSRQGQVGRRALQILALAIQNHSYIGLGGSGSHLATVEGSINEKLAERQGSLWAPNCGAGILIALPQLLCVESGQPTAPTSP